VRTSPDWVRIGPPYGQINELIRPFVNTAAMASQDVQRFGVRGHWAADGWTTPTQGGPGSSIASWSITAVPGNQTLDASNFYNPVTQAAEARQWQIYSATAMPSGQILAYATVALPYMATAMMVFELVGGATFAAFPVVPEFSVANPGESLYPVAVPSIVGSVIPAAGSAAVFVMSRTYLQAAVPTNSSNLNDEANFSSFRYATLIIRTAAAVASGAMLRIQMMRLSTLPVPWVGTGAGDLATSALGLASSLVGTWYSQGDRGIHIGPWGVSRLARFPAIATIDAQQPNGAAFEVGSAIIAGQAQWGSDLVQKNYAQSLLSPGDPLAFERIPNRSIVFPYISRHPSGNSHLFQREVDRAIKPGNVIDVIPEDAQARQVGSAGGLYRRFDLVDGRVVNNEDIRYQRAGIARGEMQLTTLPYPRAASYVSIIPIATAGMPVNVFMPGDVPAAAFYVFANSGAVACGPSSAAQLTGFMAVFVPSVATYLPVSLNPSGLTNSIASMPNGYRAAGSQINFGVSNTGSLNIARGFISPGQQEAVAGRVRAFAIMANATSATVPVQLSLQTGGLVNVATALSNVGFMKPLNVLASEMRQLSVVDLGEVRLPVDPLSMSASVQWDIYTASAASSNATAGVFDSVLFLPVGDPKGWFGALMSNRQSVQYIITASNALLYDQTNGLGQGGGGQAFVGNITRTNVFDQTSQYQGRSPYLPPGQSWVFSVPVGLLGASQRPVVGGSAGLNGGAMQIYAYPRFLFLQ